MNDEPQQPPAPQAIASNMLYCGNCDYAISREVYTSLLHDVGCPRCRRASLAFDFYSYGSQTHRERREEYEQKRIIGNPPALPDGTGG